MARYLAIRLTALVPTLFGVTILVFLLIRMVPGDVVDQLMGTEALQTQETLDALRKFFGLDQPLYVQYWDWLANLLHGDLGTSWRTDRPVQNMIFERLPVTIQLTLGALFIALLVGIPLGAISALYENTKLDHVSRVISLISLSIPIFFQASLLILLLSKGFGWATPVGYVTPFEDFSKNFGQLILPCIALGTAVAAVLMRQMRASTLEVLRLDYVRTARAKGLKEKTVVWRHMLKNAAIPVVTVTGAQIGYLLGGSLVTESVFALPGIGRLVLSAIGQRDYPVVQGVVLFMAIAFMLSSLIVDLVYAYLDPRIGYAK